MEGKSIMIEGHFKPKFDIVSKEQRAKNIASELDSIISREKEKINITGIRREEDIFSRHVVLEDDDIFVISKVIKMNKAIG